MNATGAQGLAILPASESGDVEFFRGPARFRTSRRIPHRATSLAHRSRLAFDFFPASRAGRFGQNRFLCFFRRPVGEFEAARRYDRPRRKSPATPGRPHWRRPRARRFPSNWRSGFRDRFAEPGSIGRDCPPLAAREILCAQTRERTVCLTNASTSGRHSVLVAVSWFKSRGESFALTSARVRRETDNNY